MKNRMSRAAFLIGMFWIFGLLGLLVVPTGCRGGAAVRVEVPQTPENPAVPEEPAEESQEEPAGQAAGVGGPTTLLSGGSAALESEKFRGSASVTQMQKEVLRGDRYRMEISQ